MTKEQKSDIEFKLLVRAARFDIGTIITSFGIALIGLIVKELVKNPAENSVAISLVIAFLYLILGWNFNPWSRKQKGFTRMGDMIIEKKKYEDALKENEL